MLSDLYWSYTVRVKCNVISLFFCRVCEVYCELSGLKSDMLSLVLMILLVLSIKQTNCQVQMIQFKSFIVCQEFHSFMIQILVKQETMRYLLVLYVTAEFSKRIPV